MLCIASISDVSEFLIKTQVYLDKIVLKLEYNIADWLS